MADVAAMLARPMDLALVGGGDSTLLFWMQQVLSCLPEPPVSTAARLSRGVAAGLPDGADRLSSLPVAVLREIVSRLPAKDAARTAALSRRWRRVWSTTPLVLVDAHLAARRAEGGALRRRDPDPRQVTAFPPRDDLTAAVSAVLAAHPGPFRCVYLTGSPMEAHRADIARWFQLLAAKGVEELIFVNRVRSIKADGDLLLPDTLFSCTSLTKLYIGFWCFPDTAALPRAVAFPYLREIGLCFLLMKERDLAFLLDRCPVLEKLRIVGGRWPVCIRVHSRSLRCVEICMAIVPEITVVHASLLERLLLWAAWGDGTLTSMTAKVKIGHAPKLRFLGMLMPGMHELEIGNTIIKAGTKAGPNTTVPSVQMLAIEVKLGNRVQARMVPSFLSCFPNIETLYVQSHNDNSKFGPQSTGTGKVTLKFWKEAGTIECVQRRIKKVVLREFHGTRSELDFLKFIAERAQVLEKMVIYMTHGYSPSDQVGTKLKTFMASSKWANACCELMVFQSPFRQEGTPWCYIRAFDLANQDPFDASKCPEGKCMS
ncbi:unnamed protein product [Urochloa decumbens]|uniref:F-box domain-containing protein n=1 Tax=Urochloa decumbens TaxID=240449 RepID=A0ABC8VCI7_9POAL